jgi:hypothetical protein
MDRDCTNGARQAVEDMGGEAAPDLGTLVQALRDQMRRTPGAFSPSREPLPEEEAAARAVEAVREVRRELWGNREPEVSQPSSEDVERWERSREERRKQETY